MVLCLESSDFQLLSNPIFSSTSRVNSKVTCSGCKAKEEEEWAQPTSSPRFRPKRNGKLKKNLCALSISSDFKSTGQRTQATLRKADFGFFGVIVES